MTKMIDRMFGMLPAALLVGCMSMTHTEYRGVFVSDAVLARIELGTTTGAVRKVLGPPSWTSQIDGKTVWIYAYRVISADTQEWLRADEGGSEAEVAGTPGTLNLVFDGDALTKMERT